MDTGTTRATPARPSAARSLTLPAGPVEQSPVENRPDVLVFTGARLAEPLEVTGQVRLQLRAASDAPDTDFMAKLCDVYPDGRSYNLCEGRLRARFREGFTRGTLMKPGRVYRFDLDLGSTSVIFNRGPRLRVQVTSSCPRARPKPQYRRALPRRRGDSDCP